MALPMPHRRFTVDEFEHLCRMGFFGEDERVELLAGEIVEVPPPDWPHSSSVIALTDILSAALRGKGLVSVQNPIRLADSVPLPDLAVFPLKQYETTPAAEDVRLVIEVADSTITTDRRYKFPRYAAASIAEAWLVDIKGRAIERHTEPREGGYRVIVVARRGEESASTVFPSLVVPVDTVLGPAPDTNSDTDDGEGASPVRTPDA